MNSWTPILEDQLADDANIALRGIADDLAAICRPGGGQRDGCPQVDLACGEAGIALFFAYMHRVHPSEGYDALTTTLLRHSVDRARLTLLSPSLFSGYSGIAWVLSHLSGWFLDASEDPNGGVDMALEELLASAKWDGQLDLINGLVGYGVYALERLPALPARRLLERITDLLHVKLLQTGDGMTWLTKPTHLPPTARGSFPSGYYNLGVAHGVPGILSFLCRMREYNIRTDLVHLMLNKGLAWLLEVTRSRVGGAALIPSYVDCEGRSEPSRLGWCYGNLGIAASLIQGALPSPWDAELKHCAEVALDTPQRMTRVHDPGLCHGSAGVAHLLNRLYHRTDDVVFRSAAQHWFRELLAMRTLPAGVGGFYAAIRGENDRLQHMPDPGFLLGSAGIGLSLLAAIYPHAPSWDRVLLLSGNDHDATC